MFCVVSYWQISPPAGLALPALSALERMRMWPPSV